MGVFRQINIYQINGEFGNKNVSTNHVGLAALFPVDLLDVRNLLPGMGVSLQKIYTSQRSDFGNNHFLPVMSVSIQPFYVDIFEAEKFRPGLGVSIPKYIF